MDDPLISALVNAIENADWTRLGGAVLAILLVVGRRVTINAPANAARWISAVSGVLSALAAALMAGAVWWQAAIACVVVLPVSAGFWDLIAAAIPWKKNGKG